MSVLPCCLLDYEDIALTYTTLSDNIYKKTLILAYYSLIITEIDSIGVCNTADYPSESSTKKGEYCFRF